MKAGVVRAGIVVTGTEVITGRIADANGPWVSERLAELGVEVAHILVVADRPDDLEHALRFLAAEEMDLIVTSGGLGPTADDLTAEVVARFAGRPMALDEEMETKIADILRRFARNRSFEFDEEAVMEANRKQAMVPEGAEALDPVGTAPGLVVPAGERVVVVLPGPPRELRPMWPRAIATDAVRAVLGRATPLHGLTMRMFGVPESEIAKSLREIADDDGVDVDAVEVTTCLRRGEIEIDVRWRDETEAVAMAVRDGLRRRHPRETFSLDGETIDEQVAKLLRGHQLGLAESCSGGLLAARITNVPGASDYFAGSAVTYSYAAKEELLGVPKAMLEEFGAVSPQVAEAMAKGTLERFEADVAAAITGVAGPDGGTEEKPVGYVCFHARLADGSEVAVDRVIPGDRADIRERSALVAMHLLRRLLGGDAPDA
ncbi:MAG TPA: competence/damage-inducible protein A [Solirubrobacterales bacterium]|nr:competence/damage-inducible protein A [Solirubrobacterales bacterium]